MKSVRLKHRIEIQEEEYYKDPETHVGKYRWVTVRECWAEISEPIGRSFYQAAVAHKEYVTWFYIRYADTKIVPGESRILFEDRKYEVEQVKPDHQNQNLISIQCKEIV